MMTTMKTHEIANLRLRALLIEPSGVTSPGAILTHLGAMQAQDYNGALWSLGQRLPGRTRPEVEQAISNRTIIRTWPMRGTLHFVPAADIRWMLKLLTPRVLIASAARYRELELNEEVFLHSRQLITPALEGNKQLTRNELYEILQQGGVSPAGQRGVHILRQLSQDQVLCFGPTRDKLPTFVLLDEWLPQSHDMQRDEALKNLVERYFTSHGPATLQDFVRWTGLTVADTKIGLKLAASSLQKVLIDKTEYWMSASITGSTTETPSTYLLAGFDEFMLGYKDRSAALAPEYANRICPGNNGVFFPTLVINGQVCGTWKSTITAKQCTIEPQPFFPFSAEQKQAIETATGPYEQFTERPVSITWPQAAP